MGRAPCCEKIGLKKGRWTAEEDEILMKYIQAHGEGSWRSLPMKAGLLRCGKSCRLRWINYLRGDLKRGNISPEEEEIIIKMHSSFGNRWSLIAAHLPGRTDNEIKNYWNSHLSRRIHTIRRLNHDGVSVVLDIGKFVGGPKRRGGRTRRSAMKRSTVDSRRETHQDDPHAQPSPDVEKLHAGAGLNGGNDIFIIADERENGGSGNEIPRPNSSRSLLGSSELAENGSLLPSQNPGHTPEGRENAESDSSSDSDIFSSHGFWGSFEERDSDLFSFFQGNEMGWGDERESSGSGFSNGIVQSEEQHINCQATESAIWGSNDYRVSDILATSLACDASMFQTREHSYSPLDGDFLHFSEAASDIIWAPNESDANIGLELEHFCPPQNEVMGSTPERGSCVEAHESGNSAFLSPRQDALNHTHGVAAASEERDLLEACVDWSSWEDVEDKFREVEGETTPWIWGSTDNADLSKSFAAWLLSAD